MPDRPTPQQRWRDIDRLCDRFEKSWPSGEASAVESLLGEVPAEDRPELLRCLLETEKMLRQMEGNPLTPSEAGRRFGQYSWAGDVLEDLGLNEPDCSLLLEVLSGPRIGQAVPLAGRSTLRVGRGPGVDLELPGDGQMSRVHFAIEYRPPHAYLSDLNSRNGTFVNDERIAQVPLRDGDRLRAGTTLFRALLRRGGAAAGESLGDPYRTAMMPEPGPGGATLPVIASYALEESLGQGGMGRVYRARRLSDGLAVAVKVIIPHAVPHPRTIARFQREMRILERLDHPHIVRLLESGEAGGQLYFAMEYVPGTDAGAVVKTHGPLAPERAVRLGLQLLDALAYAHGEGVIHRDVKPANLLLTEREGREVLKLADFGLARAYRASAMSGLTLTGEMAGTPAFMPPEQVRDLRSARPPADQYSAAATLYYLLTGESIYGAEVSSVELMMRIVDSDPVPLREPYGGPAVPPRLLAVIRRGLARDPQGRYPDIAAMRAALA